MAAAVGSRLPDSSPWTISRASCRASESWSASSTVFTAARCCSPSYSSTSTVSSSRGGMYESSGTPTLTCTTRPSGSVASASIGWARSATVPVSRMGARPKRSVCWPAMAPQERIVDFRPRTILAILGILLAVGIVLWVLWIARHVLTWVLISLFLALALNPAVEWLQRRGLQRRGAATAIAFLVALGVIAGIAAAFIPPIVDQVNSFANQVPDYIRDLTHGRGRLGFLETKYHVVEKVRQA